MISLEKEIKELETFPQYGDEAADPEDEEADEAEEWAANTGSAQALKERLVEIRGMLQKLAEGKTAEIPEPYIKAHLKKNREA